MSLGESQGGLPPDSCTENEATCLADMKRCIEEFHDNSRCFLCTFWQSAWLRPGCLTSEQLADAHQKWNMQGVS